LHVISQKTNIFPNTTCFLQIFLRSFVGVLLRQMSNYLNTTIKALLYVLYRVVIQLLTPSPPQHKHTTPLNSLSNLLTHAWPLQHNGQRLFSFENFTENFKTAYKYVRCCTTKYIFVLGKNKFDRRRPFPVTPF